MRRAGLFFCALAALISPQADAAPANTLQDLYAALDRCVAGTKLASGSDVTLVFMLNRKGGLIGKPRVTHAVWPKNSDPRAGAADIAAHFGACLPLDITDALGGAIAGRLISYRLKFGPPEQKV